MDGTFTVQIESPKIHFCGREQGMMLLRELLTGQDMVLVASEGTIQRHDLRSLETEIVRQGGICIKSVPSNPDIQAVTDALSKLKGRNISTIAAVGGGSAIDMAKVLGALHGILPQVSYESVEQAIVRKSYLAEHAVVPVVAVPTTAGTGSEVTQWATVWDQRGKRKYSVDMPALLPSQAVVIPALTATMSAELTLSTGLDALSHAMEAFWSKSRNPISQAIALSATERIAKTLPGLLHRLDDELLRQEMSLAALLAGEAFAQTRTTACHSISYPLTLLFHVPHGLAASATLAEVAERNQNAVPEIEKLFRIFSPYGGFRQWMRDVCLVCGGKVKLRQFGIEEATLPMIAEGAFTLGRMDNNPVPFSKDDVLDILRDVIRE